MELTGHWSNLLVTISTVLVYDYSVSETKPRQRIASHTFFLKLFV